MNSSDTFYSFAFYNLENFFDTYNDPKTDDDAFTPRGIMHWIKRRFETKSKKIAYAISQIGQEDNSHPPVLVGLAEVENKRVLKNLVNRRYLKKSGYHYIHFESKDKRGMDVALLFRKNLVRVLESKVYPIILYSNEGAAYATRDILYVKVKFAGEIIHLFINHWPSRREGDMESDFKRYQAEEKLSEVMDYIYYENPEAKFIVMGDFNSDPDDANFSMIKKRVFNPATEKFRQKEGSLNHHHKWHLFDQIMLSHNFKNDKQFQFVDFQIFTPGFLKTWHGRRKNQPYRTYKGRKYLGGYSDHFPVYVVLKVLTRETLFKT